LVVEVIDDGVGITEERRHGLLESGIGMSNVHERLKVLYGQDFSMQIQSQAGKGTGIRIEIPELITTAPSVSAETVQVSP
jgi:sensor histidine kinase YesM